MKDSSIFRQDAVLYAQQGKVKPLQTPLKTDYVFLTVVFTVLALAGTGWLMSNHYVRYQTVQGWVEPLNGVAIHHSHTNGRIIESFVKPGDHVDEGDILLLLNPPGFLADGVTSVETRLQALDKQSAALSEQQRYLSNLNQQRKILLQTQLEGSSSKTRILELAYQDRQRMLANASDQYERGSELYEKGHLALAAYQSLQDKYHQALLQNRATAAELEEQKNKTLALHQQIQTLTSEFALDNSRHGMQEVELEQKRIDILQRGVQAIVASQTGKIDSVPVHVGEEISMGQPLVHLLPADSELVGVLRIPVHAAGFIQQGQPISMRYSAYPHQKYGIYQGVISQLDETPSAGNDGNFFYTAKVTLETSDVLAHGKHYPLKTGMSFEADVMLSRRSFAEWLLEPLYSLRGFSAL